MSRSISGLESAVSAILRESASLRLSSRSESVGADPAKRAFYGGFCDFGPVNPINGLDCPQV